MLHVNDLVPEIFWSIDWSRARATVTITPQNQSCAVNVESVSDTDALVDVGRIYHNLRARAITVRGYTTSRDEVARTTRYSLIVPCECD